MVSLDGLLISEAEATLKRLAIRLVAKLQQPCSRICGYVQIGFAITMVQATHFCIRRSQLPVIKICIQRPEWEDNAVINLYYWVAAHHTPPQEQTQAGIS